MNPVDIGVVVVVVLSALFGIARGFVREVLGLASWLGAAFGAVQTYPWIAPPLHRVVSNAAVVEIGAYGIGFIVLLILFSILANLAARVVRGSVLGGIDRALGFGFGAMRGAAILVAAYVLGNLAVPPPEWPGVVRGARATPLAYQGAVWAVALVPEGVRPHIEAPDKADAHVARTAQPPVE